MDGKPMRTKSYIIGETHEKQMKLQVGKRRTRGDDTVNAKTDLCGPGLWYIRAREVSSSLAPRHENQSHIRAREVTSTAV